MNFPNAKKYRSRNRKVPFMVLFCFISCLNTVISDSQNPCPKTMAFGWGDAVDEEKRCSVDPSGKPINQFAMRLMSSSIASAGIFLSPKNQMEGISANSRQSRVILNNDHEILDSVMRNTQIQNGEASFFGPKGRSDNHCKDGCKVMPENCCEVRTEVAYPQFGQSAITEDTFTIIQDYPDFVQPVFKRVCASTMCNLLVGNCTQKYVPHAIFSAPSGKFGKIFGQDYLLVESGCECAPFYSPPKATSGRNLTGEISNLADTQNRI